MLSPEDATLCPQKIHSLVTVVLCFHAVYSRCSKDRSNVGHSGLMKVGAENCSTWEGIGQEDLS